MRRNLLITLIFVALLPMSAALAEIRVTTGPTSIPRGDAIGKADITVSNGLFAVAFAVDTMPPWGMARGGIVDIAIIRNGEIGYDIASLADFMPNRWSGWPTTYQRVTIEKETKNEVIVRIVRDWGNVELTTLVSIKNDDNKIHFITTMTNHGDSILEDLYTGYVSWPDGGSLIGSPGLSSDLYSVADDHLPVWSAAYDEQWLIGLHAPFADTVAYGGRDRYMLHDLGIDETHTFEAWLQIESSGSLAPLVQTEIDFGPLPAGRIFGQVESTGGDQVRNPAVVALKNDKIYAWTIGANGKYEFNLPAGEYDVYATAKGHARGEARRVVVANGSDVEIDLGGVRPPGRIQLQVADRASGHSRDAKMSIRTGYKPSIGYFGKYVFFTELDPVGEFVGDFPPGDYVFEISAGGGFTSLPLIIETTVKSGETTVLDVGIATMARPAERGWFGADLHHHSDVLDGFTEAEFVLRSELAAGVDIAFLSDHDSVVNNAEMKNLSEARGIAFIAGTEISPSWAHFNAFPLDEDKVIEIDPGRATVQEIFSEARRMGADVIEANHPFNPYGYFQSLEDETAPGGFDAGFDLAEIEAPIGVGFQERNERTLQHVWNMWNSGQRVYLAAGSDVHDVWRQPSGAVRTFVYVEGDVSIDRFVASLKAGHSYTSQGPLVYPDIMFGSDIQHHAREQLQLSYTVQAVSGLLAVKLIERGIVIQNVAFQGEETETPVTFTVSPESDTWYSLEVTDSKGKFSYTNPVWVTVTD